MSEQLQNKESVQGSEIEDAQVNFMESLNAISRQIVKLLSYQTRKLSVFPQNRSFLHSFLRAEPFSVKQFDLVRGKSKNVDQASEKFNNSLALLSKFLLVYIPLILFKIFSKISNPLYALIFFLQFIGFLDTPWSPFLYAYPVMFYVIVTLIIELVLGIQNFMHSRSIDRLYVARSERGKSSWVRVPYASLKVGDIVCVYKEETAPADLLLLDCSEKIQGEISCVVNTSLISGLKESIIKRAMNNTKLENDSVGSRGVKGTMLEYTKTLSGKIVAEFPTPDLRSFSGTVKLFNDPKISTANIDNMFLRGSVMMSEWAIGVVLYTGFYTKCLYGNSFAKMKPASNFRKHVMFHILISLFIYGIFVIVTPLVVSLSSSSRSVSILRTASIYLPTIPMNTWFIVEVSLVINKLLIEFGSFKHFNEETKEEQIIEKKNKEKKKILKEGNKKVKGKKLSEKQRYFEVLDYESILDLGLAEYAVFDKTGTIVTNEFEIRSVSTLNKRYDINQVDLLKRISEIDLVPPLLKKENLRRERSDSEEPEQFQVNYGVVNLEVTRQMSGEIPDHEESAGLALKMSQLVSGSQAKTLKSDSDCQHLDFLQIPNNEVDQVVGDTKFEIKKIQDSSFKNNNSVTSSKIIAIAPQRSNIRKASEKSNFSTVTPRKDPVLNFSTKKKETMSGSSVIGQSSESPFHGSAVSPPKKNSMVPRNSIVSPNNLNLEYQLEKDFREDDLFNDINNSEPAIIMLLKMFSLCHNASVKSTHANQVGKKRIKAVIESTNVEEKALVTFADALGFSLISKEIYNSYKEKLGTVNCTNRQGVIEEHDILGIIPTTRNRRRFSIVLAQKSRRRYYLVTRGDPDVMMDTIFWDEEDRHIYTKLLMKNKYQGLKTVVFGQRSLNESECSDFIKKFKDAKTSLLNHELNMESLGLEFEKDLSYFGMVGFKDLIRKDAQQCIQTFKDSGLKLWLLTGDNLANAYNAAVNSELLPQNIPEISFEFRSSDFGISVFRSIFEKLQEQTKKKVSFTFIISGLCVDVISHSEFLRDHFKFLLYFCECLIGYDLNPNHKEFLVHSLRNSRKDQECIITAIGDGFNDYSMLKIAHFGVQLKNDNTPIMNFGNAVTPSLSFLSTLFQNRLKQFTYNMYIMVDYLVYNSIFQGFILFFQEVVTNFTGVPLYQTIHIFLDQNVLHVLPCLVFIFVNQPHNPEKLANHPCLHWENMYLRKKLLRCFIFSLILALFQALIFVCSLRYFIIYGVNAKGNPITLEDLFIVIKFYSIITTKLRINVLANSHNWLFFSIMVLDIGIMMASEVGLSSLDTKLSLEKFTILFNHFQTFILMGAVAIICFLLNLILEKYILGQARLYSFTSRAFHSIDEIENKMKETKSELNNLSRIILSCFKNFSKIDTSLQNIFRHQAESSKMSITRYFLRFPNRTVHNLFNLSFTSANIFYVKGIGLLLIIGVLCFNVWNRFYYSESSDELYFLKQIIPSFGLVIWFFVIESWEFKYRFHLYVRLAFVVGTIARIVLLFTSSADQFLTTILVSVILGTYCNSNFWISWVLTTIEGCCYFLSLLIQREEIFELDSRHTAHMIISYVGIMIGIKAYQSGQLYFQERLSKMNFIAKSLFQEDASYSKELLSLLMPQFVLNRLNSYSVNENFIADDAGEVSILFCDIIDFELILKVYSYGIVKLLDGVFREFDILCRKHGVQKIETVGKTYMAAGGLRYVEEELSDELKAINFTKRVLDLAQDMMRYVNTVTLDGGQKLVIKIGINHGSAMFGVIGYHKPQFSLIGDSINTTSRLCTTGKNGHIMISESAWERVRSNKLMPQIEMTEMKGKGLVKVYHIFEKKQAPKKSRTAGVENNEKQKLPETAAKKLNGVLANTSKFLKERNQTRNQMKLYNRRSDSSMSSDKHHKNIMENSADRPSSSAEQEASKKEFPGTPKNQGLKSQIKNFGEIKEIVEEFEKEEEEHPVAEQMNQNSGELGGDGTIQDDSLAPFKKKKDNESLKEDEEFEHEFESKEQLRYHSFWLTFTRTQKTLASRYHFQNYKLYKRTTRSSYVLGGTILLTISFTSILTRDAYSQFWLLFVAKTLMGLVLMFPALIVERMFRKRFWKMAIYLIVFFYQVLVIFTLYLLKSEFIGQHSFSALVYMEAELVFICFNVSLAAYFETTFWWRIAFTITYLSSIFLFSLPRKPEHVVYIFVSFILILWQKYVNSRGMIDYYNFNLYSDAKDLEIANFVDRLLPKHVQKNIANPKMEIGDVFDEVTLLFADIVGFTAYSSRRKPKEVVEMLSRLFTEFDKECSRLNLYKVYTIGDCYVVMSFIDKDKRKSPLKECINVVEMAMSMISIIARVREQLRFDGLHMRIGIHTVTFYFFIGNLDWFWGAGKNHRGDPRDGHHPIRFVWGECGDCE